MTRKKPSKSAKTSETDKTVRKQGKAPQLKPYHFAAGQTGNPAGRPKGSRNKFAQAFVDDFLNDWEAHGASTIVKVRETDPSAYLRVASTLLPKDFNFNLANEGAFDKLLDQLSDQQLKDLVAGLSALGSAGSAAEVATAHVGKKPGSVH